MKWPSYFIGQEFNWIGKANFARQEHRKERNFCQLRPESDNSWLREDQSSLWRATPRQATQAGKRHVFALASFAAPSISFLGVTEDLCAFVENGRWFPVAPTNRKIVPLIIVFFNQVRYKCCHSLIYAGKFYTRRIRCGGYFFWISYFAFYLEEIVL